MSINMKKVHEILLIIDAIINLALGIILLLFPFGMAVFFGVPKTDMDFYPTILGAVLFGIGIALLIERYGYSKNIHGLGLEGAVAINLCGATALLVWLISTPLNLPLKGYIVLWTIVIIVFGIGIIEIFSFSKQNKS